MCSQTLAWEQEKIERKINMEYLILIIFVLLVIVMVIVYILSKKYKYLLEIGYIWNGLIWNIFLLSLIFYASYNNYQFYRSFVIVVFFITGFPILLSFASILFSLEKDYIKNKNAPDSLYFNVIKFVLKPMFLFLLIAMIIFKVSQYMVKEMPNYSTKDGFELVWKSDYDKYQKGYCLKENKILSDEEILTKGLTQYIEKKFLFEMKAYVYCSNLDWTSSTIKPQYYIASDVNFSNYKADEKITVDKLKRILKINLTNMTAGFTKPVTLRLPKLISDKYYLDKSFLLKKDNGKFFLMPNSMIRYGMDYTLDKENYTKTLSEHKNNILNLKLFYKIDNCGNIEFDVEESYEAYEPHIGVAG